MKKTYLLSSLYLLFIFTACTGKASHEGHQNDHATHKHGCGNHDHDHSNNHSHSHDHFHDHSIKKTTSTSCSDHDHGNEEHSDEIIFSVEQAQAAGVKAEIIAPQTFQNVIPATGQILTAQGDESVVVANVSGIVSFPSALTEGVQINKGRSLVTLSSRNLLEGDPVAHARITYETARKEYLRAQELVKSQIISEREFNIIEQEYLSAEISYEAVANNQTSKGQSITAPINGYIKNIMVSEGDYVEVGQPLVTITQNKRLYLRAEVPERNYKYLSTISSANFKTPYDDQVYRLSDLNGRILSYGKSSDTSSFYLPVTFEFNNQGNILPGSYVSVYLLSTPMHNVMVLPRTALTEEQGLFFIYLQLDEEGYKKQPVVLGADNGKEVHILSGIHPGDRVVTEGAYHVKLASAVNALPAHSHEH